jgi:hypothetical protein
MYHGHHTQSWAFTLSVISSQHSSRILITLTTLYSSGPSGQKRPWSPDSTHSNQHYKLCLGLPDR